MEEQEFDESILAQIIIHIQDNMKEKVGKIIHIGNNEFTISVGELGFLSGITYDADFKVVDNKVVHTNGRNVTMG